ncbi:MAG: lytic polysaccharide monooxygenase [Shewanella sp.]|uniref:lytic polysaccharide monooxygenase n=1 Tax=Aeromonas popoffii TaxID=70856 RepID=UPI003F2FFF76
MGKNSNHDHHSNPENHQGDSPLPPPPYNPCGGYPPPPPVPHDLCCVPPRPPVFGYPPQPEPCGCDTYPVPEGITPAHGWLTTPVGRTQFAINRAWLNNGHPASEMEGMKNFPLFTNYDDNRGLIWFDGEGGPYADSTYIFPGVSSPLPDGLIFSGGQTGGNRGIVNLTDSELLNQHGVAWPKTAVEPGQYLTIHWNHTAVHSTRGYRYFITRDNWNPNRRATRADFEEVPFASVINRAGQGTPIWDQQSIALPRNKTGHHIILSIWLIADTGAGFYSAFDVDFGGGGEGGGEGGGDGGGNTPAPWRIGVRYEIGDLVTHQGYIWRCTYANTSNAGWAPGAPGVYLWAQEGPI